MKGGRTLRFILIAALVLIAAFVLRRKIFGAKEGSSEYMKVGDPGAQVGYDKEKSPDSPKLTAKELLELSWKFLYSVTEAVLYKFSATSRKMVNDCGDALVRNGARYTHVIDYAPFRNVARARSVDSDSSDPAGMQR